MFDVWCLEAYYVALLKMTIRKELGDKGRLEYQILMSKKDNGIDNPRLSKDKLTKAPKRINPGGVDTLSIKNPFVIPGIKKLEIDPQLNPNYIFDNFIEGDCNRLARSAGLAVAKKLQEQGWEMDFLGFLEDR